MADLDKAIKALKEARPPVSDNFTYLAIVESHLSPEILPTLNEMLQNAELTQAIGWDLVLRLIRIPGSEACLETVARLGNPREVILKVLETLQYITLEDDQYTALLSGVDDLHVGRENGTRDSHQAEADPVSVSTQYIVLLGMLAILHKRIQTKYPNRFLAHTLQAVLRAYHPNQKMTAAVINLVHSLAGGRRPTLPTRESTVTVANPDRDGDASKNAPDPEAEGAGADVAGDAQDQVKERLLLSFVTCILKSYVDANDVAWAGRLVEFLMPEKMVPGRQTLMATFREDPNLQARDAMVGQLVALTRDLGLTSCSEYFLEQFTQGILTIDPLAETESPSDCKEIRLSTGGCICIAAYWVFSATVFDADQPTPDIYILSDHFDILQLYLPRYADLEMGQHPGTMQAVVTLGLWLQDNARIHPHFDGLAAAGPTLADQPVSDFMGYLHLLTLIAVHHPSAPVRNATIVLAGQFLHADPWDVDRLAILKDLLEHCQFVQLKACAVTWLREELLSAPSVAEPEVRKLPSSVDKAEDKAEEPKGTIFSGPKALETLQTALFPRYVQLRDLTAEELFPRLLPELPYLVKTAAFGRFLWGWDKWGHVVTPDVKTRIKYAWYEPLLDAIECIRGLKVRRPPHTHDAVLSKPENLAALAEAPPPPPPPPPPEIELQVELVHYHLCELAKTEAFQATEKKDRA